MSVITTLAKVTIMATVVYKATKEVVRRMERSLPSPSFRESALERAVVEAFRRGGWEVESHPHLAGAHPDLVVRRGDRQYVVEIKSAAEPRRDRLLPLLAQAILEAEVAASKAAFSPPALPLAVVGAAGIPDSLIDGLRSFAEEVAPDVSIGIIDLEGPHIFIGPDVGALSRLVPRSKRKPQSLSYLSPKSNLFSDLNQWMLKALLARRIPENLMHAPREDIQSVSDLAKAASVSLMSASRFVSLLRAEGFLDESRFLDLVNVESLLLRWRVANQRPIREIAMRWIIPGDSERQLFEAVSGYLQKLGSARSALRGRHLHRASLSPRICLGLFAAADAMGFRFVHGVAPHVCLERVDSSVLELLGLRPAHAGERSNVFIRVPAFRESVFRPAVMRDGVPVCDIVQVWLDVSDHPARGMRQGQEIWRRVLAPIWKRSRA